MLNTISLSTFSAFLLFGSHTFSTQLARTVGIEHEYVSLCTIRSLPLMFKIILSELFGWPLPLSGRNDVNVTDAIHAGCTDKADMSMTSNFEISISVIIHKNNKQIQLLTKIKRI